MIYDFDNNSVNINPEALRFIPLGGIGEIGMNMFAYEYKEKILIVDCGLMFPAADMYGVDIVIPDMTFILENKENVVGMVLTHGHEDHVGGIPYLLSEFNDIPIYGTKLTLGLLQNKLDEHTYLDPADLREVSDVDKTLALGPFNVDFFRVTHSIRDGVGIIINTPVGSVIHTGDFKFDRNPLSEQPTEEDKILAAGKTDNILALMSDTTNAEKSGWVPSEQVVVNTFCNLFKEAQGRVIIATFASNISRMQEIINISHSFGRKVCVIGRSMLKNLELAMKIGYITLPDADILVDLLDVDSVAHENLTILTTGSQGEPLSALRLMSTGDHKYVKIVAGDLVVMSASPIPGNEALIFRTINYLYRRGAKVIYDDTTAPHVSGHGNRDELKLMIELARAKNLVPVHGEYRHLAHYRDLAKEVGYENEQVFILDNGDILELYKDGAKVIGMVTAGQVFVDGLGVGDVGKELLRERRKLSEEGIFVPIAVLSMDDGRLLKYPKIVTQGFVHQELAEEFLEEAKALVVTVIEQYVRAHEEIDIEECREIVRLAVNRLLRDRTKRKPIVIPVVQIV